MDDIFSSLSTGTSLSTKNRKNGQQGKKTSSNNNNNSISKPAVIDLFGCKSTASSDVNVVESEPENLAAADPLENDDSSDSVVVDGASDEDNRETRNRLGIKVIGGGDVPDLQTRFMDMNFDPKIKPTLLHNIEVLATWKEPSPIQMQAIPTLLAQRDVLAIAPTGSGKTGAYVLPMLSSVSSRTHDRHAGTGSGGIHGLILVPTHELAEQVYREMLRLSTGRKLEICCLNSSIIKKATSHAESLSNKGTPYLSRFDVLISTPGRLLSVINQQQQGQRLVDLSRVGMIILDEADKLFENDYQRGGGRKSSEGRTGSRTAAAGGEEDETEGEEQDQGGDASFRSSFLQQVDTILAECSCGNDDSSVVKGLFSATVTPFVQELAHGFLTDHLRVQVGTLNATASTVKQSLCFCGNEQGKLFGFRQLITDGKLRPPTLLFVQSIERAKDLLSQLAYDGVHIDMIHSDLTRSQRDDAIRRFRSGETWVLICTDLLARGIDFQGVKLVINYDLPTTPISYIHRIGRTGRAGREGEAITFFVEQDIANLRSIANVMKISGCDVPDWMLSIKQLSTKDKRSIRRHTPKRHDIGSAVTRFDEKVQKKRKLMVENSRKNKNKE